jgi:transcriptional repressor AefR-like protein
VARRPAEADVGGFDALGLEVRPGCPEHRVGARERLVDDIGVAVRSLHDLDARARVRGQTRRILLYEGSIRMCRVSMAETTRFPEGAAQYVDLMFTEVHTRLSTYLKTTFELSPRVSVEAAQKLLGQVLYLRFPRALFGMDPLVESLNDEALAPDFELKPIRKAVADVIDSLEKH